MIISDETVTFIKRHEGLRLEAYRDPVGVWTIGYGHSENAPTPPTPVSGMRITEEEAESILRSDLEHFADRLRPMVPNDLPPNVFGALLSLSYNIGLGAFANSTARKRILQGDVTGAAAALQWWNKAGDRVLPGLVRRRKEEAAMMLAETEQTEKTETDMVGLGTGSLVTRIALYVIGGVFAGEAVENLAGVSWDAATNTIAINVEILLNVILGGGAVGGALGWRAIASRLGGKT